MASRLTVMSLQTATGGIDSTTVTFTVQSLLLPQGSSTEIVTLTGLAVSEQSKLLMSEEYVNCVASSAHSSVAPDAIIIISEVVNV